MSTAAHSPTAALHPRDRARLRTASRRKTWRAWRQAVLIALPIVAGVALSAQATFSAIARTAPPAARSSPDAGGTGAAGASPARGATGTIALPAEPVGVPAPIAFGATIAAARPFVMAGASAIDRGRALECLTAAIYYEAASESDDGQRAVAQVVLNRARHAAFPGTVCGVVYQGSERTSGCQFSFACDGALARAPSRPGWMRAMRHAALALSGQVFAPVGLATHYHTYAVTPIWNRTLVMTDAIGAHFFHRWKGYWGTAAAFSRAYRGGEPLPGPHGRNDIAPATPPPEAIAMPMLAGVAIPAVSLPPPAPPPGAAEITARDRIQPAHAESGATLNPRRADEAQILDRWKNSGTPLR